MITEPPLPLLLRYAITIEGSIASVGETPNRTPDGDGTRITRVRQETQDDE